jgi:hypothetical protein
MFASNGINLPKTSASAIFLDALLLAGPHLDSVLERKRLEVWRLSQRLELMPSHDCLYLLYATFSLLHALCIPFQDCALHLKPRDAAI